MKLRNQILRALDQSGEWVATESLIARLSLNWTKLAGVHFMLTQLQRQGLIQTALMFDQTLQRDQTVWIITDRGRSALRDAYDQAKRKGWWTHREPPHILGVAA